MSEHCSKRVFRPGVFSGASQCKGKVKIVVNGKAFCAIHSPDGKAKREARYMEKWDAERRQRTEANAREEALRAEHQRKIDAHDVLVAALREIERFAMSAEISPKGTGRDHIADIARVALAKATP